MTGKEYLINYIQNHSSTEIYDEIKKIERATFAYNDSRLAFIEFLDNYDSLMPDLQMNDVVFKQDKNGKWIGEISNDK